MKTSKRLISNTSLVFLFTLLICFSCKKNEDFEQFNGLTVHKWQLIEKTQEGQSILENCEEDNVLVLNEDGAYTKNYGTLLCDIEAEFEDGVQEGKWKIRGDGSDLRLSYNIRMQRSRSNLVEYWQILQLTSDTLVIVEDYDGGDPLITETYIKK